VNYSQVGSLVASITVVTLLTSGSTSKIQNYGILDLKSAMSIRRIKTIAAGILLGLGLPITIACIVGLVTPSTPQTGAQETADRNGAVAALIFFGMPPTILGSWLIWSNYSAVRGQQQARDRQARDRLQATFFKLLRENNGHINVLRFAMEANLSGEAAKVYLDERAKEFNAAFNVSEAGKLFYIFDAEFNQPAVLPGGETYDVVLEFFPTKNKREVVQVINALTGLVRCSRDGETGAIAPCGDRARGKSGYCGRLSPTVGGGWRESVNCFTVKVGPREFAAILSIFSNGSFLGSFRTKIRY
jgi:hypothetical protein